MIDKILKLLCEYQLYEVGTIELMPTNKTIMVPTQADVISVWLSIQTNLDPYNEIIDLSPSCFIGEAIANPTGFQFEAIVYNKCQVNWIAIESEP